MASASLHGQVVVVTGAASGIGLACAEQFVAEGAIVVGVDRNTGPQISLVCDVSNYAAITAGLKDVQTKYGRIDVLVNCAGTNTRERHFSNSSAADWDSVLAINLSGMFYGCQAVIPGMRDRGIGTIINFASWAGKHAAYFPGVAYSASKRGVLALTESINIEEGLHGIRATAIVPEEVATEIVDRRPVPPTKQERARMLTPQDVANAVVFVASQPPRACINELVISPTWNRDYLGLHGTAFTLQKQKNQNDK